MKSWLMLSFMVLSTFHFVHAQSTNVLSLSATNSLTSSDWNEIAATNNPELAPPPFRTELARTFAPVNLAPFEPKPNEIQIGDLRASGIAVELVKTGDPLSLINPLDPPINSSPEDNVVRD